MQIKRDILSGEPRETREPQRYSRDAARSPRRLSRCCVGTKVRPRFCNFSQRNTYNAHAPVEQVVPAQCKRGLVRALYHSKTSIAITIIDILACPSRVGSDATFTKKNEAKQNNLAMALLGASRISHRPNRYPGYICIHTYLYIYISRRLQY